MLHAVCFVHLVRHAQLQARRLHRRHLRLPPGLHGSRVAAELEQIALVVLQLGARNVDGADLLLELGVDVVEESALGERAPARVPPDLPLLGEPAWNTMMSLPAMSEVVVSISMQYIASWCCSWLSRVP